MFKFLRKKMKGQSTLEYAILIIIIIGALLSINYYIKRGIQGRLGKAADDIGEQFSPGNTNYSRTTVTISNTHDTGLSGVTNSVLLQADSVNTVKRSTIMNVQQEFFGK